MPRDSFKPGFKKGDREVVLANEAEGWSQEVGEFIGYSNPDLTVAIVRVDREFRRSLLDDGLREIEVWQHKPNRR